MGYFTGLYAHTSVDVAVLAAAGRGHIDGEPIQGSVEDFIAGECTLLRPSRVLLSHHDNFTGTADAPDLTDLTPVHDPEPALLHLEPRRRARHRRHGRPRHPRERAGGPTGRTARRATQRRDRLGAAIADRQRRPQRQHRRRARLPDRDAVRERPVSGQHGLLHRALRAHLGGCRHPRGGRTRPHRRRADPGLGRGLHRRRVHPAPPEPRAPQPPRQLHRHPRRARPHRPDPRPRSRACTPASGAAPPRPAPSSRATSASPRTSGRPDWPNGAPRDTATGRPRSCNR